jgi:large subunit ribosomal protein L25
LHGRGCFLSSFFFFFARIVAKKTKTRTNNKKREEGKKMATALLFGRKSVLSLLRSSCTGTSSSVASMGEKNAEILRRSFLFFSSSPRRREQEEQLSGGEAEEEERRNSAAESSSSSSSSNTKISLQLIATEREKSGRLSANRARKEGLIPCAVFKHGEIENTSEVCAVSEREVEKLLRKFTIYGLRTKLIDIVLDDGKRTMKAIPKQIQMHAYKNQVNNITFMGVDPDTIVKVPIPVKVTGHEDCPGTKLGAFVHHTRKTIKVKCRSDQIPQAFFADVSKMNVQDKIRIANLDIPQGVVICENDLDTPVVKMAGKLKKT